MKPLAVGSRNDDIGSDLNENCKELEQRVPKKSSDLAWRYDIDLDNWYDVDRASRKSRSRPKMCDIVRKTDRNA